jgi:hypothetical protein
VAGVLAGSRGAFARPRPGPIVPPRVRWLPLPGLTSAPGGTQAPETISRARRPHPAWAAAESPGDRRRHRDDPPAFEVVGVPAVLASSSQDGPRTRSSRKRASPSSLPRARNASTSCARPLAKQRSRQPRPRSWSPVLRLDTLPMVQMGKPTRGKHRRPIGAGALPGAAPRARRRRQRTTGEGAARGRGQRVPTTRRHPAARNPARCHCSVRESAHERRGGNNFCFLRYPSERFPPG